MEKSTKTNTSDKFSRATYFTSTAETTSKGKVSGNGKKAKDELLAKLKSKK